MYLKVSQRVCVGTADEDLEEFRSLCSSADDRDPGEAWMDVVIASAPHWTSVRMHRTPRTERLLQSVLRIRSQLAKVIAGKLLQWPVCDVYDILLE